MSFPDTFQTLAAPGRSELRERASRFFGFADHIEDEDMAAQIRADLKRQFHDADHQPFALRLAYGSERCGDDGEPRGTAGHPILNHIRLANLYEVQVVVVRYFGGTKLGRGGLARAFGECARLSLALAGKIETQIMKYLDVICEPVQAGTVRAAASRLGAQVVATSFDNQARLRLAVPGSAFDGCQEALIKRFGPAIIISATSAPPPRPLR